MNSKKLLELYNKSSNKSKIAGEIGISRVTLNDMTKENANPTIDKLEKVARYFGVPIGYFFDEENIIDQNSQNKIKELEEELHALRKKVKEYDKEIIALRKENELLFDKLKDKEKIISLLEGEKSKNADEDQSIAM